MLDKAGVLWAPIAFCPEHGLHGGRSACFACNGPVEQVPMLHVDRDEVGLLIDGVAAAVDGTNREAAPLLRKLQAAYEDMSSSPEQRVSETPLAHGRRATDHGKDLFSGKRWQTMVPVTESRIVSVNVVTEDVDLTEAEIAEAGSFASLAAMGINRDRREAADG